MVLFISLVHPDGWDKIPCYAEGVELRLDRFPTWNFSWIEEKIRCSPYPVMVTLRSIAQEGGFSGSAQEQEKKLIQVLGTSPAFCDLEYGTRKAFVEEVVAAYPKTQFVLSYHAKQLEESLLTRCDYPVSHYKIALRVHSSCETLRLLLLSQHHPHVSAIPIGEEGAFGRVLGPIVGNKFHYTCLEPSVAAAPGQIDIETLYKTYGFPSLTKNSALYGLIGNPVSQSLGARYHNARFKAHGIDAVYVKMKVPPEALADFLPLAQQIGFRGLSVTAPLKEGVIPFVDVLSEEAKQIGAVNTLRWHQGKIYGYNTDGKGALDAIEKTFFVRNKTIILIGAGGAARSIAWEAKRRGAHVVIVNRTIAKAEALAHALGVRCAPLSPLLPKGDLLINSTSIPPPLDWSQISLETLVMDLVYVPKETAFLQQAAQRGCSLIYGEEMFKNQAEAQAALWSQDNP